MIAQYGVRLTSASLDGAALSMHAAAALTASSVRLPSAGSLTISGPSYNIGVNLLSASGFAVLGGSAIVNTVSSLAMANGSNARVEHHSWQWCVCCNTPVLPYYHLRAVQNAGSEPDRRQCRLLSWHVGPDIGKCEAGIVMRCVLCYDPSHAPPFPLCRGRCSRASTLALQPCLVCVVVKRCKQRRCCTAMRISPLLGHLQPALSLTWQLSTRA